MTATRETFETSLKTTATEPNVTPRVKVAYIMSRFPKLTETFILYEILAVEQESVDVELYPLLREPAPVMHPEAVALVERAHFQPFLSWAIVQAQLYFLFRNPLVYLKTLFELLSGTIGSYRFFKGALGIFPKTVYFARHMRAAGVDHVHAHFASHPAAAAFVIYRLTGIPYSFTAHGSDLHRDRTMLKEKIKHAEFVVAISDFNKEIMTSVCEPEDRNKIHVIHCGVDTAVFQPRTVRAVPGTPLTILCVGTLHEVKGQRFLIEACRLLLERGVAFSCHFVGDGPDQTLLEGLVQAAGLQSHVHFEGRKSRDEVVRWFQRADVVVAPSVPSSDGRREGIPVVLMEAMGSGVPVVASRLSGIPELVTDGVSGVLTTPGNASELADALHRLTEDDALRQQLGGGGRQKVIDAFDLSQNAAALTRHFREAHS